MRQNWVDMAPLVTGLVLGACAAPRSSAPPAPMVQASSSVTGAGRAPDAVTVDSLSAIATRMLDRRSCADTCCVGELPVAYERAWPGQPDIAHAAELRAILDGPAPAAARGVAALWLARALDVSDIPRLSRCADETEAAGVFPTVLVGQMARACDSVQWEEKTLGRACIDAIARIVSRDFANAAELRAWLSSHDSPLDTYDYWQKVLTVSRPAPDELLESLRRRNPELYFKVAALDPDVLGPQARPAFVKVARDQIGGDRILRLLRRQDTWPELDAPGQFGTFATTVLRLADAIFEPRHGPELLASWENRTCCTADDVRAALAVACSRLVPDQARRVLKDTLGEASHAQAPLLEELARRFAAVEQTTLDSWFLGANAKRVGGQDDLATAILRGLKDAGQPARPVLAALVRAKTPNAASQSVAEELMAAAIVMGYPAPEACRGYLGARAGKGSPPADWARADREALDHRTACEQGALGWLRGPAAR